MKISKHSFSSPSKSSIKKGETIEINTNPYEVHSQKLGILAKFGTINLFWGKVLNIQILFVEGIN